eukprot:234517-Chlamydomonas_euryale.AAC.2
MLPGWTKTLPCHPSACAALLQAPFGPAMQPTLIGHRGGHCDKGFEYGEANKFARNTVEAATNHWMTGGGHRRGVLSDV